MTIKGKITKVLPIQEGSTDKGPWKKRTVVIQNSENEKFPTTQAFDVWNDLTENALIKIGGEITADIDFSSREYNDKFYHDVKAWRIS